ncbi:MAG: DUF5706 domain-containing protein [Stagnimonas sp.]|nr:DUF5706 domain-containing protein [Stagnimonas sp.]
MPEATTETKTATTLSSQGPVFNVPQAGAHLDLMIRQTRIHHMTLSISADAKANMLMIASSVVLSLAAKEMVGAMQWHSIILTVGSLASVCMAIFAAMPKFPLGFKKPPASRNVLFFNTFAHLSYEQFLQEMEDVMSSPAKTYEMQLREIYEQGLYLKKAKYRFVQAGYSLFLLTLFSSAVAWVIEAIVA